MKINMGLTDKIIRSVIGAVLIGSAVYFQTWWAVLLGILGLINIIASIVGNCPAYNLFGFDSSKKIEVKKYQK